MDYTIDQPITERSDETAGAASTPLAKPDKHIWGIYIFLVLVAIIELYSASSREVNAAGALGIYTPIVRHCTLLAFGFGIIFFLQRIHYKYFLLWIPIFTFVSFLMMGYVMVAGEEVNGARRAMSVLGFTLQPSEFIKLSAAGSIAMIMALTQMKGSVKKTGIMWTAAIVLVFAAMLVPQGLTNTLLLLGISVSMMIVGGVSLKKLFFTFLALVVAAAALYGAHLLIKELTGVGILDRMEVWMSRLSHFFGNGTPKYAVEMTDKNQQELLSYMAQAHGGVFGVGPGNSREVSRLPLAFSDYIFSIIVEELGLLGAGFITLAYLWLLGRASAIASQCSRAFPALLVIAMALVIVLQALFHIAIVAGVFPVSGQPLPLISKGGTSIIVSSIAFGVMLSVSRFAVRNGSKKDIKLEMENLPEEARAENPSMLS